MTNELNQFKNFLENKYIHAGIVMFILLYASQIKLAPSDYLVKLLNNTMFRVGFLFFILYRGYKDPIFSLLMAIAFILLMNQVNQINMIENFTNDYTENNGVFTKDDKGIWRINRQQCNRGSNVIGKLNFHINTKTSQCNSLTDSDEKEDCVSELEDMIETRNEFRRLVSAHC